MTEKDIDEKWPVLAQVVRAIEWHGNPDPDYFCRSFAIEAEHCGEQLDKAEAELAVLSGKRIVELMAMEAGEPYPDAPNAALVLSRYFS
jgi:hypothetical protein